MKLFKQAAAGFSAAAIAAMLLPSSAFAVTSYSVTFHYETFNGGNPLTVLVDEGETIYDALEMAAYNREADTAAFPAPSGGKAVSGWVIGEGGTEQVDLNAVVTKNLVLYPETVSTVSPELINLTVDEACLPKKDEVIQKDLLPYVSVPSGAQYTVTRAYYDGYDTWFADNKVYLFHAQIQPADGQIFDFTYNSEGSRIFRVQNAAVNGESAALQWSIFSSRMNNTMLEVVIPFSTGNPETVKVNLHYNGHGTASDRTVEIPKGTWSIGDYLNEAAGEVSPYDDNGYHFDGWYTDEALANGHIGSFDSDTDLYAKWVSEISEVNFNVATPLCGDEVEQEGGSEPISVEDLTTEVRNAVLGLGEDGDGNPIVLTNEPDVTCDTAGIAIDSFWITSATALDNMTLDTEIQFFMGTIYGENDYLFIINATRLDGTPYFAEDLKITVNGVTATVPAGRNVSRMPMQRKPSTHAGIVSKAVTVSKGGNSFVVIGTITADHAWGPGVITKEADCDENGIMTYTCRIKDASYTDDIDAFGHHWEPWKVVTPATAAADGLEMRVCDNNGEHKETRVIPKGTAGTGTVNGVATGDAGPGAAIPIAAAALIVLGAAAVPKKKKQNQ